jgi:tetratricopeptide (TPR) repeat protein
MTTNGREGWADRLTRARQRMFPTSWQAAKALARLDPANLPDAKTLHRYWSERWETGAIRPNRTYRELIERLLDAPGLFHDGDSAPLPPPNPAAMPALPAAPAQPVHPVQDGGSPRPVCPPTVGDAEFEHRPVRGREVRMAADEAAENAAKADTQIGASTLEGLHGEVLRLARGYARQPVTDVFRAARRTRELAAELIERTRRPAQLADLYTVAGQACGLLATAAFDMGYWDAAARFADSALTYADIAGHNGLRAWAQGKRAFMANWLGHPDDALNHIDAALSFAPTGTATARLRAFEARTRALLGDADGATRAVRSVEDAREVESRDELHDGIGGEFGYNPAQQELSAGTAYVTLRDGMAAEQHAQRALDILATFPPGRRAYYTEHATRVDLAIARLLRGDLAGAREALVPVFALPPAQRVSGVTSRLEQARALLGAEVFRTSRIARRLATDIADFTADTTGRALPPGDL